MMLIGRAAGHGGFELKVQLAAALRDAICEVMACGIHELFTRDDCHEL